MISITVERTHDVVTELADLSPKAMRGAVRSMNRAINAGRTVMVREISRDTGLRATDVRDAMPVYPATRDQLKAQFGAGLKRIPLIYFRARGPEPSRGRGRGVSYGLPGGRSRIPNAFIATMSSGHRGVFARMGTTRLPIVEMYGPSLGHVFAKYRPLGLARTREAFDTAFAHELDRLTSPQEPTGD